MSQCRIAGRMERIVPFYVMDLLARAKDLEAGGRSIVHMEVGEPDFPTPAPVLEAGKKALDDGHTGYTPATGIVELRRAICEHYRSRFDVSLDPRRVIITPGASGALQLLMGVLINPGEEVLMTDPGYPCNKNFVRFASGVPVTLPVGPETGYQLSGGQIREGWGEKTRAVLVATPSNPTGTLVPKSEMARIVTAVKELGGVLIVDEIYQGLVYDTACYSALTVDEDIFVINSFSKYFGMTGWRLGWIVAPEAYVDSLDCLAQNIFLSCSAPAQYAAVRAFTPACLDICEERRRAFKKRRDFLLPALRRLGFEIPVVPEGAFYLYANCASLTDDSFSFAYELLEKEGVAVTPGKDFGANHPECHIRFAYTNSVEQLAEGVRRIERFIAAGGSTVRA